MSITSLVNAIRQLGEEHQKQLRERDKTIAALRTEVTSLKFKEELRTSNAAIDRAMEMRTALLRIRTCVAFNDYGVLDQIEELVNSVI